MTSQIVIAVLTVVLFLVFFGVVIALLLGVRRGRSRRGVALAEQALRMGLRYQQDDPGLSTELPPFELLNRGRSRKIANVMRGEKSGSQVVLFDYSFYESPPRAFLVLKHHRGVCEVSVACLKTPSLSLPDFVLEPSSHRFVEQQLQAARTDPSGEPGLMGRGLMSLASHLGTDPSGWSFPDLPYGVRGTDEQAVRRLFSGPLFDHFRAHQGWIVEGSGPWLLFARPALFLDNESLDDVGLNLLRPQALERFLSEATTARDVFRRSAG